MTHILIHVTLLFEMCPRHERMKSTGTFTIPCMSQLFCYFNSQETENSQLSTAKQKTTLTFRHNTLTQDHLSQVLY